MTTESIDMPGLEGDTNESPAGALGAAQDTMNKFLDAAGVEAVYGEPVREGDTIVVPAAEVVSLMGFGLGFGGSPAAKTEAEAPGGYGGGGGGGGRILSRPVAVVIISPSGERVEPVVDVTKLGLAALTAFGFMAATLWRMSRPRRALKAIKDT